MNRRRVRALLAVILTTTLGAVSAAGGMAGQPRATGTGRVVTVDGAVTGDMATLVRRDRFGPGDPAGGYLVLDPQGGRFAARFSFPAPGAAVDVLVALRAPGPAQGR